MAAAFLTNFLFWTGASIGAVAFAAFVEITGGEWAGDLRVLGERLGRFLPLSLVAFIGLMWKHTDVYPWAPQRLADASFRPSLIASRDAVALIAVYASVFAFCRASR